MDDRRVFTTNKLDSTGWYLLKHDPETGARVEAKYDSLTGAVTIRESQPIEPILEQNLVDRNEWTGWRGKKHGAIVSRIPVKIHNELKKQSGFDGVEYDRKYMNKLLQDRDYRKLQVVPGRY
jgi:hypothetical protein